MTDLRHRAAHFGQRFGVGPHGLPSAWTLWWFPALVAIAFLVLVALSINGSSTGIEWSWFRPGSDPDQLFGSPRAIRSDEWFVQQSWTIAQYHQGFPRINPSMPGGTDLTVLYDVPTAYWSTGFRPQLWGYFVLDLGRAIAWHWWLPPALCAIATYLFVVTLNPRRPATAALLATATTATPMLLWWYQSTVFYVVAWPLLASTALIWVLRHPDFKVRLAWMVPTGLFAVTLALSSYLPYILCGLWVFVFFAVGVTIDAIRHGDLARGVIARRLAGFVATGAAAGAVMVVYAWQHRDVLRAIAATVYPGRRSDPTGLLADRSGESTSLFSAPFSGALRTLTEASSLGINQSEASSTIMLSVFLIPGIVVLLLCGRRQAAVSGATWALLAATTTFLAYLYIGGWDVGARILQLDKIPAVRARIAFAVLLPAVSASAIQLVDRLPSRPRRVAAICSGLAAVVINVAVWRSLRDETPNVLAAERLWQIPVLLICLATVLFFFRRLVTAGGVALLAATVWITAGVLPLHRGVVDLHDSVPGQVVRELNAAKPGVWVGTAFPITTALLLESGVPTLNGFQSYPDDRLWSAIDPEGEREASWNRYAHLDWRLGTDGTTAEELVDVGHLLITMDPCSSFAQDKVGYVVVTTDQQVSSDCLDSIRLIDTPGTDLEVFRVTAPTS